jgi:hypothetical protein
MSELHPPPNIQNQDDDDNESISGSELTESEISESDESLRAFANPMKSRDDSYIPKKPPINGSIPAMGVAPPRPSTPKNNDETGSVVSCVSDEGEKLDYLAKLYQLRENGHAIKDLNIRNRTTDIKLEFHRVSRALELKSSIKFQQRIIMAIISTLEYLNKRFDPFDITLEGWSENVLENIDDFHNIFEKLHEKYRKRAQMAPEIELIFAIAGSAFMFNLTNSLFKNSLSSGLNLSDLQSSVNLDLLRGNNNQPSFNMNDLSSLINNVSSSISQHQTTAPSQATHVPPPPPVSTTTPLQKIQLQELQNNELNDDEDRFSIASSSISSNDEPSRPVISKRKKPGKEIHI